MIAYSFRFRWPARLGIVALGLIAAAAGILSPFFQKVFVDRLLGVETAGAAATHGWGLLAEINSFAPVPALIAAFACTLTAQAMLLLLNFWGYYEGMLLQKELSERLYRKMLGIRGTSMGSTTVGEVVSIFATDVAGATVLVDQGIPMATSILFPLLFAPVAVMLLSDFPLWPMLVVIAVAFALNVYLATRQAYFFLRFKQLAAERIGIVNEWVQNVRLLRILGWIESFEGKIFAKRREETANRFKMVSNGQSMAAFGSSISYIINLTGVASLVFLSGRDVTPGELFALLWILGVFMTKPFRQLPWIFTFALDSITSIRRLEGFLMRPSDAGPLSSPGPEAPSESGTVGLSVRGLSLSIRGEEILSDISFDVRPGELVAVIGEVGAGKSLLGLSLMGETGATFSRYRLGPMDAMKLDQGQRRRFFAYVPQDGFVMSASLRENVAFRYDCPPEEDPRLERSLELAQFALDTEYLSEGIGAEIGERGVNLSGGQRQRVSLARAHHADRPVIFLDDCLSALDVDTESQLLRDLILGEWRGKTRILITHRLSALAHVDRVLFMENGRIVEDGKYEDLLAKSERVRGFVATVAKENEKEELEAESGEPRLVSR